YGLPRGEQLRPHDVEHGLLRLPPTCLVEHANAWWGGTESHHGGLPDLTMLDLPRHPALGKRQVRSHHDGLSVAGRARNRTLRFVPRRRQLQADGGTRIA